MWPPHDVEPGLPTARTRHGLLQIKSKTKMKIEKKAALFPWYRCARQRVEDSPHEICEWEEKHEHRRKGSIRKNAWYPGRRNFLSFLSWLCVSYFHTINPSDDSLIQQVAIETARHSY